MEESALFKQVSENEREAIKKQARSIIESFAKELEKITIKEKLVERAEDRREEKEEKEESSNFKKIMIANSEKNDGDCIIAEKGKWLE